MNKEHAELVESILADRRNGALGHVVYQGSRDELNAKLRARDEAIERLSKDNERLANSIIGLIDGIAFLEEAGVAVGSTALKDELAVARTALQLHKGE